MYLSALAHRDNEKSQSLINHLLNVARESSVIGAKINLRHSCYLVGLLHDVGKADKVFQRYILGETSKKVIHSSAGAKYLYQNLINFKTDLNQSSYKLSLELLCGVIESHHGLFDVIFAKTDEDNRSSVESRIYDKLNYDSDKIYDFTEIEAFVDCLLPLIDNRYVNLEHLIKLSLGEINEINIKIMELSRTYNGLGEKENRCDQTKVHYYYHALFRLMLSILKEVDVTDSILWVNEENGTINCTMNWIPLVNNIENLYTEMNSKESSQLPINRIRTQLANKALENIDVQSGVYTLSLPTGAGKTKLVSRYVFHHADLLKKDRFVYVTAFLSVLEQNAKEIRKIINNDEIILEHHSNVIDDDLIQVDDREDDEVIKNSVIDSWKSPIILTTMVQFFDTLFKGKSSNLRRFSSLINCVVVIDEIQSLPSKVISMYNLMANFMSNFMGCTIIHCSATQPTLGYGNLKYPLNYSDRRELVEMKKEELSVFDRYSFEVTATIDIEQLISFIKIDITNYCSVLCVVNIKKTVKRIYDELTQLDDVKVYYLTTNMCAAHRLDVIQEVKTMLLRKEKVICVSTQLVEAGVDMDFNVVYRSMAGIDSLIQSAGRCNREGMLKRGKFVAVNLIDELNGGLTNLPEIKEKQESAKIALMEFEEGKLITDYVENYYKHFFTNNLDLDYRIKHKNSTLLRYLSRNTDFGKQIGNYVFTQQFSEAAKIFQLIENNNESIVVPYKESKKLIKELEEAIVQFKFDEIRLIIKKLQRYTINVYPNQIKQHHLIELMDGSIKVLLPEAYDENIGVKVDGDSYALMV